MNIVSVQHTVADYDKWKIGYDGDEPARRASGCTSATVSRAPAGADGSTGISVSLQFPDPIAFRFLETQQGLARSFPGDLDQINR